MINFLRTIQNLIKFFLFTNIRLKQFVFFSENRNYSNVFYPIIMKLLDKKIYVIYITSDKKDFFYNYENEYLISFYISKVIGQISLLNYIECRNLILTMPDLDNFHIKKSSKCRNYVYLFHSPVSTNMIYRNRAFFNYNKIFCVGEHHYKELTNYKKKFDLKDIDLFKGGYPKLDHLVSDYNNRKVKILKNKVTIAPSWGKKNLIHYNLDIFFQSLLNNNFQINFRPHYQMIKFNSKIIKKIQRNFSSNKNFLYEGNNSSFENVLNSEILITDWSGMGIEYAFITGMPVIYVNTEKKVNNKNFNDIEEIPIEIKIRDKIGIIIEPEELKNIVLYIEKLRSNLDYYKSNILEQREKYIFNFRLSSSYITEKILKF